MNYELAKELKEAGFPQKERMAYWMKHDGEEPFVTHPALFNRTVQSYCDAYPLSEMAALPTLEELIEACGEQFVELRNFRHEMWALYNRKTADEMIAETWDDLPRGEWIAESTEIQTGREGTSSFLSADGFTPSEATAKLWLELNKK